MKFKKKLKVFFHLFGIYIPFRILVFFSKLLPFFLIEKISRIIGIFAFLTLRKTRERVIKNLEIAFKDRYSKKQRKEICKEIFINIITNFLELDQFTKIKEDKIFDIVEIENEDILNDVLRENKGVVAICAHLGNFPIAQTILSKKGYPVNMIVRETNNRYLARYASKWRKKLGVLAIPKWNLKKSLDESKEWIKKGGILCFYIDQYSRRGVKCGFFGKDVYFPVGPAVFSRKYDTPVIGIFTFKEGKKNRVIIEGPYKIQKTDNPSEDIKRNTSFFIKRIENFVSQYPSQWFTWLHRIFR